MNGKMRNRKTEHDGINRKTDRRNCVLRIQDGLVETKNGLKVLKEISRTGSGTWTMHTTLDTKDL